ncbi:MAG: hypothetical protein C0429_16095 [Sphingopyxis sp.]|nr:hypothetical protein [Sphingopyxis sp.]
MSVSKETMIVAAPERVWAALVAFDDYASWHPMVRIEGDPQHHATLRYSLRMEYRSPKFLTVDAQIISFEPQRALAFSFWSRQAAVD